MPGASNHDVLRALNESVPPRLRDTVLRMRASDTDESHVSSERQTSRERLRRACRGDLDTILAKALKKAPRDRYQTLTAFADDLRRHLNREPVLARPDSTWYRWRRFAARHRIEFGAAAAVIVTLVTGAVSPSGRQLARPSNAIARSSSCAGPKRSTTSAASS